MSQDIIADTLNEIMNAKRSHKSSVIVDRHSNLLINVLEIAKKEGYIKDYKKDGKKLEIKIGDIMKCAAVKPRFDVTKEEILKYMKRYLPARDIGVLIVSTSKGLMTHKESFENKIGGCLIAYFY